MILWNVQGFNISFLFRDDLRAIDRYMSTAPNEGVKQPNVCMHLYVNVDIKCP